mmetsp:Transcript_156251/g.271846  ORF Transcript_156251/g.271846 Transcript_156251/m.271846 type:complete len:218 (+) Transcript_156251:185-838(+)
MPDFLRIPWLRSLVQLYEQIIVVVCLEQPRIVVHMFSQMMAICCHSLLHIAVQAVKVLVMDVQVNVGIPIEHPAKLIRAQEDSVSDDKTDSHFCENVTDVEEQMPHCFLAACWCRPTAVHPIRHWAICGRQLAASVSCYAIGANELAECIDLHKGFELLLWPQQPWSVASGVAQSRRVAPEPRFQWRNAGGRPVSPAIEMRPSEAWNLADVDKRTEC